MRVPSTAKAYPDFGGSTSEKTSGAASVSCLFHLRQVVREAMVRVHLISPALAAEDVSQMDDKEVLRRFRMYAEQRRAEIELSAASPNPEGPASLLPGFLAPNDDGRPCGTQPCSRPTEEVERGPVMPESVEKEPGPKAGAFFAPASARVGNKKPGIVGRASWRRSREGS